jgi:hypothetical protein
VLEDQKVVNALLRILVQYASWGCSMAGSPLSQVIHIVLELVGFSGSRVRPGPLNAKVVDFQVAVSVSLHSEAMTRQNVSAAINSEKALNEYLLRDKPHDTFSKCHLLLLEAKRWARQPQPDFHKSMEVLQELQEVAHGLEDLQIEAKLLEIEVLISIKDFGEAAVSVSCLFCLLETQNANTSGLYYLKAVILKAEIMSSVKGSCLQSLDLLDRVKTDVVQTRSSHLLLHLLRVQAKTMLKVRTMFAEYTASEISRLRVTASSLVDGGQDVPEQLHRLSQVGLTERCI